MPRGGFDRPGPFAAQSSVPAQKAKRFYNKNTNLQSDARVLSNPNSSSAPGNSTGTSTGFTPASVAAQKAKRYYNKNTNLQLVAREHPPGPGESDKNKGLGPRESDNSEANESLGASDDWERGSNRNKTNDNSDSDEYLLLCNKYGIDVKKKRKEKGESD